jgi:small subunit ribosomal protein S9
MQDEEQQQDGEQAPEEQPEGTPEEQQADEQQAPEEATPTEGGSPERGDGEGVPAEEALSEDAATEDDTPAEEASAPAQTPTGGEGGKKEDVVPGAELDPIAIEPERELDAEERARREAEEEERLRRERELIGDVDEDAPLAAKPAKLEGDASYSATGKRKSSIARVILRPGSGPSRSISRALTCSRLPSSR